MEELQELVYKGLHLLQKMQGGNIGMRVNNGQGGGYSGGNGGNSGGNNIGMRQEHWPQQPMSQQGMQQPWVQGSQNHPQNWPNMVQGFDPRIFM